MGEHQIGIMHGRLSAKEKTDAIDAFASGEKPVLISTTVIEVRQLSRSKARNRGTSERALVPMNSWLLLPAAAQEDSGNARHGGRGWRTSHKTHAVLITL